MPRHALVIAAIFVPYLILMVGLGIHIYRTGYPDDPSDTSDRDDEEDGGGVTAAA